jgi:hypothetical protein
MDNTYEPIDPAANEGNPVLSFVAIDYLLKAAKWAKFLSIVGFIVAGILAIVALFVGTLFSALSKLSPAASLMPAAAGISVTIIYLFIAAVIFVLHLFLFQFASRTQMAILSKNSALMEGGMHRLQSYFKMLGIIMILYLAFVVLCILGMIAFTAMIPHTSSATSF